MYITTKGMAFMKKIIGVLLALALCAGIAGVPAFAEESAPESLGAPVSMEDKSSVPEEPAVPIVQLGGYGMPLYLNDGTPEAEDVLDNAMKAAAAELPAVLKGIFWEAVLHPLGGLRNPNRAADALADCTMRILGTLACDENGESIQPVSNASLNEDEFGTPWWYEDDDWVPDNEYEFHFDWRLDPMESARALDAFIQEVKRESGSEKVHLYTLSFGGVVCCAYLAQFGTGDLESVFLFQSAHGGMTLAEDLIQKKFAVSGKGLAAFLGWAAPRYKTLIKALELVGIFKLAEWLVNPFLRRIKDRFYERAMVPLLVQMPGSWGFITETAIFDDAKETLLGDPEHYAGLIEKIDDYHYKAGWRTNEILAEAAKEIKLALVCGYGHAPIPLGGTFLYQSDFMIGTARASGGAFCADYGKTLPKGYAQANPDGHNHLSGDRIIDASACVLPEQTWFVKGLEHTFDFEGVGLYHWFLAFDGQPTVWSDPAYPQFRG